MTPTGHFARRVSVCAIIITQGGFAMNAYTYKFKSHMVLASPGILHFRIKTVSVYFGKGLP